MSVGSAATVKVRERRMKTARKGMRIERGSGTEGEGERGELATEE